MLVVLTGNLRQLRKRCGVVQSLCWAKSTWRTRNSQWKRFDDFCRLYGLMPIPASVDVVCLYITFLSDTSKFSTISNYVSAIWTLHEFMGVPPPAKGHFLVKCTLMGARRLLGDYVLSADPLLPDDLVSVYAHLNHNDLRDLTFWAAICLMFRCLLRVSHVTKSVHNVCRKDIVFTSYGLCLTLFSSKTIQFSERKVTVPVISSKGSILCPVFWIRKYLKHVNVSADDPLFVTPGSKTPVSYKWFSSRLKSLLTSANLVGNYSSHSLRRGAATFLSRIGLPLHDIKTFGDWKSLSVLLYLSGDVKTRLIKDATVAKNLRSFHL